MKNPVIRAIYLYLFALIGLGMLVVGASMIVNLGLKAWIFTKADQVDDYRSKPPTLYLDKEVDPVKELQVCGDKCQLTKLQQEQISNWLVDYETWESNEEAKNPNYYIASNRQRQASTAISLILIGLPVWLFHWGVIKRDVREDKKKEESKIV